MPVPKDSTRVLFIKGEKGELLISPKELYNQINQVFNTPDSLIKDNINYVIISKIRYNDEIITILIDVNNKIWWLV